jgi:hypothetical protein
MLIPKTMVVEQLRVDGDTERAERADDVLGEKVDAEPRSQAARSPGYRRQKLIDQVRGEPPVVG